MPELLPLPRHAWSRADAVGPYRPDEVERRAPERVVFPRCSSQEDRVAECRHVPIRVTHLDANEL
jgi:hypothetical protein